MVKSRFCPGASVPNLCYASPDFSGWGKMNRGEGIPLTGSISSFELPPQPIRSYKITEKASSGREWKIVIFF